MNDSGRPSDAARQHLAGSAFSATEPLAARWRKVGFPSPKATSGPGIKHQLSGTSRGDDDFRASLRSGSKSGVPANARVAIERHGPGDTKQYDASNGVKHRSAAPLSAAPTSARAAGFSFAR